MADQQDADLEEVDEPTYDELVDYLENYGDIVDGLDGVSELSPLAREVKTNAVLSLLIGRAPDVLDPEQGDRFRLYLENLNGVTTEVESIVGTDPQSPVRKLAVWAIVLGVAADIEDSLFPEQQLGDSIAGRIRARYLAILKQLRGLPTSGDADGALGTLGPLGTFPPPLPDVFEPYPGLGVYPLRRPYR